MFDFQKWMKMNELESLDTKEAADILYIGAILTDTAQKLLYNAISKAVAIPDGWRKFCHHMTIRYVGLKPINSDKLPVFGEDVTLVVTEVAADEKGVAVMVEPNTNGKELKMSSEQMPHITVATAPGTPPVYSNELLRKGTNFKMREVILLTSFIGAKMKNGSIMPERSDAAKENFTL